MIKLLGYKSHVVLVEENGEVFLKLLYSTGFWDDCGGSIRTESIERILNHFNLLSGEGREFHNYLELELFLNNQRLRLVPPPKDSENESGE